MEALAMQRNRKPFSKSLLFFSLALAVAAGCGSEEGAPPTSIRAQGEGTAPSAKNDFSSSLAGATEVRVGKAVSETPVPIIIEDTRQFPKVRIETTKGDIYIRLNAEEAPETVDNFLLNYVDQGFYDNTIFHHVDKEYMILAGGYTADLQQGETREAIRNEADNGLKNVRGTIAMSRSHDDAKSATCEFIINLADNPKLDHKSAYSDEDYGYCVFGEVTHGMEVADRIGGVAVEDQGQFPKMPSERVVITSIERAR
jgi:peptidyl-prolyl cis-trans isomerase B (cyclophilin B)